MGWYRSTCHFDDCEQRFVGVSKEEYVTHVREQHGALAAKITQQMLKDTCPQCSTQLDAGVCHRCGWTTEDIEL